MSLFTPIQIGAISPSHRVVMAPLTRLRADADHVPLPMSTVYYEQRASVPGTFIIAEATLPSLSSGGVPHAPGLFSDAQIQTWKQVTDAVHAKGSYIFCQLVAPGRAADPSTLLKEGGYDLRAPSAIPMSEDAPVPRALTEAEIHEAIHDFVAAGRNAMSAGFDGVEVHGANGYLVDQFMQDVTNQRSDGWGGSIERRARFGVEVAKALAEAIGPDRVGFRISPFNTWQGMKMADPVPQFSYLVKQLGELRLAYLHVIESRVVNNVDCEDGESIKPFLERWGSAPVLVAGGYKPENVCKALDEDYRGFNVAVVFGRHFLANPDLPFRLKHGIPLQKYDRDTFYAATQAKGYADYPFSEEFLATQRD
ncbi:putative N-ethylmaleimide reductase [Aspergillus avenaceus]|uniref:Putative N-ethylmaleimide reductase n=1 Tax=Aspergillus avenaceus TaxID=36643 RepID=A0A5N6TXF5_ASPAV|nr:putative N-ethylmaleimide reductase [Aspergillus avenaceus]